MLIQNIIKSIELFNPLNKEEIEKLSTISNVLKYPKGSILFYEGETNKNILFLKEGLIKFYKVDKYDNEIFLYHIAENSMISELSSIYEKEIKSFGNAELLEDSEILSINYESFSKYFLENNILTMRFMEIILLKNHKLQSIINRELVFDATAKVSSILHQDLIMVNKLKRQAISFILHIQPETLSRVLKKLQRSETIKIENSKIIILNKEQLISNFRGVSI